MVNSLALKFFCEGGTVARNGMDRIIGQNHLRMELYIAGDMNMLAENDMMSMLNFPW